MRLKLIVAAVAALVPAMASAQSMSAERARIDMTEATNRIMAAKFPCR